MAAIDFNHLIIGVWLLGAAIGLFYSVKGMREAWADLVAVANEPITRDVAASMFKTQALRATIQLVWLFLGVLAIAAVAGVLILWGLVLTNLILAYLSRAAYQEKRKILNALIKRSAEKSGR